MAQAVAKRKQDIRIYTVLESRKEKSNAVLLQKAIEGSQPIGRIDKEFSKKILITNNCTINVDGRQINIRYMKGAPVKDPDGKFVSEEEQKKRGFTKGGAGRDEIWMLNGSLVVNADQDRALADYIEVMTMNEGSPYRDETKEPWFRLSNFDEESKERMEKKYQTSKATTLVYEMELEQAKDLLRLAAYPFDPEITEFAAKDILSGFAVSDPDFIINGVQSSADRKMLVIRKAIEKGLITTMGVGGYMSWVKLGDKEMVHIVKTGDLGGSEGKIIKFAEYLETEEGGHVYDRIKDLLDEGVEYEVPKEEPDEDEDDEDGAFISAPVKKRGRPKTKK